MQPANNSKKLYTCKIENDTRIKQFAVQLSSIFALMIVVFCVVRELSNENLFKVMKFDIANPTIHIIVGIVSTFVLLTYVYILLIEYFNKSSKQLDVLVCAINTALTVVSFLCLIGTFLYWHDEKVDRISGIMYSLASLTFFSLTMTACLLSFDIVYSDYEGDLMNDKNTNENIKCKLT